MEKTDVSCDEALGAEWWHERVLAIHLKPLLDHYDLKWRGHGLIYVDHQEHNIISASMVITDLSILLKQPSTVIRARLIELGWLRDVRNALPSPNEVSRLELLRRVTVDRDADCSDHDEEFDEGRY